jgi:hypothetical protein
MCYVDGVMLGSPGASPSDSRMKKLAYLLAIICLVITVMYAVLPGGSLPAFIPGYEPGSTHVHHLHAVAAGTGAIIFLLIGLSARR